jgi:hypothetical protein
MAFPTKWNRRNNLAWVKAIRLGQEGTIKPTSSKELAGKRVRFVGWLGKRPWVKLLESAEGYDVGATFEYMLKWVDWQD